MSSIADHLCPKCGSYNSGTEMLCGVCMSLPAASESAVATGFLRAGLDVATPARDNAQYDMLVRFQSGWKQVQVKTVYYRGDKPVVNVCRNNSKTSELYLASEVDLFVAVEGKVFYLIPYAETKGRKQISLHTEEAEGWKNNASICV